MSCTQILTTELPDNLNDNSNTEAQSVTASPGPEVDLVFPESPTTPAAPVTAATATKAGEAPPPAARDGDADIGTGLDQPGAENGIQPRESLIRSPLYPVPLTEETAPGLRYKGPPTTARYIVVLLCRRLYH